MSKKARAIAAAVIASFYVAHGLWLICMFLTDTGCWLGAFALIPVHFCMASGVGVAAFFCLKWARNRKRAAMVMACFFIGIILVGLLLFPAGPHEEGPVGQMAQYNSVFRGYPDNIKYEDLFYDNRVERAAAKAKYPESDTVLLVVFDRWTDDERECWMGLRDNIIVGCDETNVEVSDAGGDTVLMVTDPLDPAKRKEHEVLRADIDEVANGQGSLDRDTYSVCYFSRSGYANQANGVRTGGDVIFEWVLRAFK